MARVAHDSQDDQVGCRLECYDHGIDMWLHPWHRQSDQCFLEPIFFDDLTVQSRQERLSALTAIVHRVAAELPAEAAVQEVRVRLNKSAMYLETASGLAVQVPLCLSEVAYAVGTTCSVIALAARQYHRCGLPLWGGLGRQPAAASVWGAWLFVVAGAQQDTFHELLNMFGECGVVRHDFHETFVLDTQSLASGAHGSVHMAHARHRSERSWAAKVLPLETRGREQRVDNEIKVFLRAQGHPNVVRFRGVFLSGGEKPCQIILMDICGRGDLQQRVQANGPLAEREALEVLLGVLSALVHVHALGLVHRDVKASNILFSQSGQPQLTDFGIATCVIDDAAMDACCGTLGYAAPEVFIVNWPKDERQDVFSAGAVLYYMLLAVPPFVQQGLDRKAIIRRTRECAVTFDARAVSSDVERLARSLLVRRPINRPRAVEARAYLRQLLSDWSEDTQQLLGPAVSPTGQAEGIQHNVAPGSWLMATDGLKDQPQHGLARESWLVAPDDLKERAQLKQAGASVEAETQLRPVSPCTEQARPDHSLEHVLPKPACLSAGSRFCALKEQQDQPLVTPSTPSTGTWLADDSSDPEEQAQFRPASPPLRKSWLPRFGLFKRAGLSPTRGKAAIDPATSRRPGRAATDKTPSRYHLSSGRFVAFVRSRSVA